MQVLKCVGESFEVPVGEEPAKPSLIRAASRSELRIGAPLRSFGATAYRLSYSRMSPLISASATALIEVLAARDEPHFELFEVNHI